MSLYCRNNEKHSINGAIIQEKQFDSHVQSRPRFTVTKYALIIITKTLLRYPGMLVTPKWEMFEYTLGRDGFGNIFG